MKETDFNEAQESKEENIDVKELLFKYLIHWPWFVGAVVACLIAAWVYLYMSTPVYNISATVLIKDDKKGGSAGMLSGLESLGLDGMISSSQNIDNEIEVLHSKTIPLVFCFLLFDFNESFYAPITPEEGQPKIPTVLPLSLYEEVARFSFDHSFSYSS